MKPCVFGALLMVLTSVTCSQTFAQKPAPLKVTAAKSTEYTQLAQLPEVVGRLSSIDEKKLSIVVSYVVQAKPSAATTNKVAGLQRQWNRLMVQEQQAMNIRNPNQRFNRLQQIANQMQRVQVQMVQTSVAEVKTAGKQFDLPLVNALSVRRLTLPFEYDDRGYPRYHTKAELEKLRGNDPKIPGYAAKFEDLESGQTVKVYLNSSKPEQNNEEKAVDKGAGAKEVAEAEQARPNVRMIVIVADADSQEAPAAADKKKKN